MQPPFATGLQNTGVVDADFITGSGEFLSGMKWSDLTADVEDWAFQGVDTTYWSMLNNSMNGI